MAEAPFFSSQGSHYDEHRLSLDQENVPSSPPQQPGSPHHLRSSTLKPKALPTVTPKRFTRFFTPRNTSDARGGRQSKASRQLRDITKNGVNRRRSALLASKDDMLDHLEQDAIVRPAKRRKCSLDLQSSPPLSSPLKRVQVADAIQVYESDPVSPVSSDAGELPDLLESLHPFPPPIRRLKPHTATRRVLERSFGDYGASRCKWNGAEHCADWRTETAHFVSTPMDVHSYRPGTAIPFCTASCHTNSLVAIGDEEGSIRLIDTAASSNFASVHVNFRVHMNAVMDVAFSSDDYMLATASGDQTCRVVDMHTQRTLCVLSGHSSSVKQVRFQPNEDNILTTSSRDGTVQIWDLRCSERGSMQSLRLGQMCRPNEDGILEPPVRFPRHGLKVGTAHRSKKGTGTKSPSTQNPDDSAVSITSIEYLQQGSGNLLVTSSEVNASVKLWDLRSVGRREPVPLSATPLPDSHMRSRNFGISNMALSGDGARLYTLCKDATVYTYSTNHLIIGHAPEMALSDTRRRTFKESKLAVAPLYAFKHPQLSTSSFWIKLALRPAKDDKTELLAVGSGSGSPILFPTDERYLPPRGCTADDSDEEEDEDLPTTSTARMEQKLAPSLPVSNCGTALIRGHKKEATSLTWSYDGDLVTVSDDFTARCWREDARLAREMRGCGEGGGKRWGHGWAAVDDGWDDEDC
jgi:WD40 repeat protein